MDDFAHFSHPQLEDDLVLELPNSKQQLGNSAMTVCRFIIVVGEANNSTVDINGLLESPYKQLGLAMYCNPLQ